MNNSYALRIDQATRSPRLPISIGVAEELLTRAFENPNEVLDLAREVLPQLDDDRIASLVARAGGVAARELYLIDVSRTLLNDARDAALRAGDDELRGLAVMSLAATASYGGSDDEVFNLMDIAQELLTGEHLALALNQRAGLLQRSARYDDALEAFELALALAPSTGLATLSGEILQNRGVLFGYLGSVERGIEDTSRAADVFKSAGWHKRHADMIHNLGWLAGRRGNLVESLRLFDDAAAEYRSLGIVDTALAPDRCDTLIAAGLLDEAAVALDRWIEAYRRDGNDIGMGEALLSRSRVDSARREYVAAHRHAARAGQVFEACGRAPWVAVADSLRLGAAAWIADASVLGYDADADQALALVEPLMTAGLVTAAVESTVVAAELAAASGDWKRGAEIARSIGDRSDLLPDTSARLRVDYVSASALFRGGDIDAAQAVCTAALREFYAAMPLLGGTELRAHAGLRAERLAVLSLTLALEAGHPSAVFTAIERHRANSLAFAPVLPPADENLAALMNEHRALQAELVGLQRRATDEQQRRAESLRSEIRRRSRHLTGVASVITDVPTLDDVLSRVAAADVTLVVFAASADRLVGLVVTDGAARVVRFEVSVTEVRLLMRRVAAAIDVLVRVGAASRIDAHDALRRRREAAQRAIEQFAGDLSTTLLEPLSLSHTGVGRRRPLVVVPPSWMAALPWSMLSAVRETPVVVAPSVRLWLRDLHRSLTDRSRAIGQVTVVVGPRIATGRSEAEAVRSLNATCRVLVGHEATVDAVLAAMASCDLMHLACHGTFRADNPMFSSLELVDGPLFLYDLERLTRTPQIVVLTACHAALGADRPGDELIGIVATLLGNGSTSVIASVAPVDDSADTVAAMASLHANLAVGLRAGVALHLAQQQHRVLQAFVCFGSG